MLCCRQKVANPLSSLCRVVKKKVCPQQSEFVGDLVEDVGVDQTNGDYPFCDKKKQTTSSRIREDKGDRHTLPFNVVRLGKLFIELSFNFSSSLNRIRRGRSRGLAGRLDGKLWGAFSTCICKVTISAIRTSLLNLMLLGKKPSCEI